MMDGPLQVHAIGSNSFGAFGRFGKSGSYDEWEHYGCLRVHLSSQQLL